MVFLGLLSFFQIVFIPGYIFLHIFKFKKANKLQTIIYSFSLSLLINYLLVYYLTLIKAYNLYVIYSIFAIELFYLIYIAVRRKRGNLRVNFELSIFTQSDSLAKKIFIILSFLTAAAFSYFFISNIGKVFNSWDAVFSWNRWAIDWYLGEMPYRTYLYPQLIPANWSITYIMMQNHYIHLFAKSIMPLFTIFTLALYVNLYLKKRDIVYLLSLIFYAVIIISYSLVYIRSGYVDIAVGFFSFLAFHSILDIESNGISTEKIMLIMLFSTAAAITKQTGAYMLIFSVIFIIFLIVKNRKTITGKDIFKKILMMVLVIVITLPWYLFKIIEINRGLDFSTISFLVKGIHHDATYIQRFMNGLATLRGSAVFFLVLMFLVLVSIFVRKSRWFSIGITLPLILAWGFFFSYDDRNIIPAFPFIAYSAAFGIEFIYDKFLVKIFKFLRDKISDKLKSEKRLLYKRPKSFTEFNLSGRYIIFTGLIISVLIMGVLYFYNDNIAAKQIEIQKLSGNSQINNLLYDYKDNNDIGGKIITDYYWATTLPGFEGSTIKTFKENDNFIILSNSDSFPLVNPLEIVDDNIYGFLISDMYYNDFKFAPDFKRKILNGELSLIFEEQGYYFIKINKIQHTP